MDAEDKIILEAILKAVLALAEKITGEQLVVRVSDGPAVTRCFASQPEEWIKLT